MTAYDSKLNKYNKCLVYAKFICCAYDFTIRHPQIPELPNEIWSYLPQSICKAIQNRRSKVILIPITGFKCLENCSVTIDLYCLVCYYFQIQAYGVKFSYTYY